jgi:hypothetical protein
MLRALVCVGVCLFVFSGSANADSITLTGGSLITSQGIFGINAFGPNFAIQGSAGNTDLNYVIATCTPAPCAPGSVLSVGGFLHSSLFNSGFPQVTTGFLAINGVTFPDVFFEGRLTVSGSVILPADFVNGQDVFVPFTLSGEVMVYLPCQVPSTNGVKCQLVSDFTLIGSGIARATLPQSGTQAVQYDFAAPVPEPATFGLFGTGLLAVKALRKRRRP